MHHLLRRYPFDLFIIFVFWACVAVAYAGKPYNDRSLTAAMYCAPALWLVFRPVIALRNALLDDSHITAVALTRISAGEFLWRTLRLQLLFAYLPAAALMFYHIVPALDSDTGWETSWLFYAGTAINVVIPSAMCVDLCAILAVDKSRAKIARRVFIWVALILSGPHIVYVMWWGIFFFGAWRWIGPYLEYIDFLQTLLILSGNLIAPLFAFYRTRTAVRKLFVFR